jgi:hypothetical protein
LGPFDACQFRSLYESFELINLLPMSNGNVTTCASCIEEVQLHLFPWSRHDENSVGELKEDGNLIAETKNSNNENLRIED